MIALAALLIASALTLALPRVTRLPTEPGEETTGSPADSKARHQTVAATAIGVAAWLLAGAGPVAAMLGVLTAVVANKVLARLSAVAPVDQFTLGRQAADAAELMAACLAAGATLPRTTAEVAIALEDPIAGLLAQAASLTAMGASAEQAWAGLAVYEPTAPISRAVIRSETSGAPAAEALAQCAADLRDQRKAAAGTMVRSVTVATVGPLGLCFLPAFVLLGVVPIVAGLIGGTINGV